MRVSLEGHPVHVLVLNAAPALAHHLVEWATVTVADLPHVISSATRRLVVLDCRAVEGEAGGRLLGLLAGHGQHHLCADTVADAETLLPRLPALTIAAVYGPAEVARLCRTLPVALPA